jgi:hypothetical protein
MNLSTRVADAFLREAALWQTRSIRPLLFWRDDDVADVVPNLATFLDISNRYDIPIVFAAIPTNFTEDAARMIRQSRRSRIAVHGYRHTNHSSALGAKTEYGAERPAQDVLFEIGAGRSTIEDKAGDRFLNLFVPPWGLFDKSFRHILIEAGYAGISELSRCPRWFQMRRDRLAQIDCQVVTERQRQALALDVVIGAITYQLALRRKGRVDVATPIGLLTHHRMFDSALVQALVDVLDILNDGHFTSWSFAEIDRRGLHRS